MEFLFEYGLFLAKVVTGVLAIVIVVSIVVGLSQKSRHSGSKGHLEITPLNEMFDDMSDAIKFAVMDESLHKAEENACRKTSKRRPRSCKKPAKKQLKIPMLNVPDKSRGYLWSTFTAISVPLR